MTFWFDDFPILGNVYGYEKRTKEMDKIKGSNGRSVNVCWFDFNLLKTIKEEV